MVQAYPILFVVLPPVGTNRIEDLGKLLSSLFKKRSLLTIRLEKYLYRSVHTNIIAYMLTFCQEVRFFSLRAVSFHPIGIKLRGSDKQSSIWHHKEKQ
jgi:hypothetical protein